MEWLDEQRQRVAAQFSMLSARAGCSSVDYLPFPRRGVGAHHHDHVLFPRLGAVQWRMIKAASSGLVLLFLLSQHPRHQTAK
jgi:hypothetical protein